MRCVIICAGNPPSRELFESCSPCALVIAADGGINCGIVPDILIGDFDSTTPGALAEFSGEVIRLPREKDDTDLLAACKYAVSQNAVEVTILGALGGRVDHELGNIMALSWLEERRVSAEILSENCRVRVIGEKCLVKKCTFSVIPFGGEATVDITGAKYSVANLKLKTSYPIGISNMTTDVARIVVKQGKVIVIENF